MPHRIGNLWDIFVSEENCIRAEIVMGTNRPDNRMAQYIKRNPEKFGRSLSRKLKAGYSFHAPRERDIKDSYKGKTRHLKISCLEDVAAQQAWLNVAVPHIEKRNYYYNCGSIPGAGQTRAVAGMKKSLRKKKSLKWAAITDIRKFYESCPHKAVMDGLRKIFKDESFLRFASLVLENMSGNGVGIAIGYPVSHWFANVALMGLDHEMRRRFPDVVHFRYMDDVPFMSRNKKRLRKALMYFMACIRKMGMEVKRNWQVFRIEVRGILFLSYRFFLGYTLLAKRLMVRISRKMVKASKHMTERLARGIMSYLGILKYCDSQNFKSKRVYPYVNIKACRQLISDADKKRNTLKTA